MKSVVAAIVGLGLIFGPFVFDFQETAERSLARHWHSRTPEEQSEFVRLFADLVVRSYVRSIEEYGVVKIAYVGDAIDGDQAVVRTRIITKIATEVPIDYRMLKRGEQWRVYDVIIEGVSLVSNYRTQFNKIIQRRWCCRDSPFATSPSPQILNEPKSL